MKKSKQESARGGAKPVRCEDIQALLMDYHCKELSAALSEFVGGHLHFCPRCQKASVEIRETVDMLKKADVAAKSPEHLTEERRDKIWWALTHPVLRWIEKHHTAVSVVLTLLVLAIVIVLLIRVRMTEDVPDVLTYPVTMGVPVGVPPGTVPAGDATGQEEKK